VDEGPTRDLKSKTSGRLRLPMDEMGEAPKVVLRGKFPLRKRRIRSFCGHGLASPGVEVVELMA